ncbi:MAG: 16S rRNA (uracil(1498)-N(3))-methyltransferase [Magnetococcales bacterium]|nr:16S rRNA (uracil(1498)-N(3))-methyltransferase [Magnetococcales bacterium]
MQKSGLQEGAVIRLARVPERLEQEIPLAPNQEPLLKTWQARVGEVLTVVDPKETFYRGRVLPGSTHVRPFEKMAHSPEPPFPRRLCQAIPDRERMIWIVQKGVELGVTDIQPLLTERANTAADQAPRQDKSATWPKVALGAAKQCRRAIIPPVHPPAPLEEVLTAGGNNNEMKLFLDWHGEPIMGVLDQMGGCAVSLFVGPEGGLTPEETDSLRKAGGIGVSLGFRLLRTETAALGALALMMAADGAFTQG